MLPARRIASTTGFTCRLFAFRRTDGVRTMPILFKDHGSAAAATSAISESPLVMAATAATLSAVATVVGLVVAARAAVEGMAVAAASGSKSSKQSFFLR